MSTSITKNQAGETYVIACSSESTYNVPKFGSRDSVIIKNATGSDMTLSCQGTDTVDGATTIYLKGYSSIELLRGTSEWVAVRSYDKADSATTEVLNLTGPDSLDTATAAGDAFTNQPANDGIEVVSDSTTDITQTVTIIGTTQGTDTVVVETVTLTGTTAVSTAKTDWGVVLAVKKSAATVGTVTVREASGNATITAGLTASVLSLGVNTVAAADQRAYNRPVSIVCSGSGTKQIGIKGTDTSDAVIYDSQALNGTTAVTSNSSFRSITEIYTGDLEASRTATVTNNSELRVNGAAIGYSVSSYSSGTSYVVTNTSAAVDCGTTDPLITIDKPGTYLIKAGVTVAYNGATVVAETAEFKVRRTNNTPLTLGATVLIDLPVATTLTHTYGQVTLPAFIYTTTNSDDVLRIFAGVSATLGAGSIDVEASGTYICAVRLY